MFDPPPKNDPRWEFPAEMLAQGNDLPFTCCNAPHVPIIMHHSKDNRPFLITKCRGCGNNQLLLNLSDYAYYLTCDEPPKWMPLEALIAAARDNTPLGATLFFDQLESTPEPDAYELTTAQAICLSMFLQAALCVMPLEEAVDNLGGLMEALKCKQYQS